MHSFIAFQSFLLFVIYSCGMITYSDGIDVIGAGFGRTGTLSLKFALGKLGFGPTFHMTEIFAKPNELIPKWTEIATLRGNDAQKSRRQEILKSVYHEYKSAVDFPSCLFFEDLIEMNPEAKVILLTRDFDEWYTSARQSIFTFYQRYPSEMTWGEWAFKTFDPIAKSFINFVNVMWKDVFLDIRDKEQTRKEYEGWITHVKSIVKPSHLLVVDVHKINFKYICEFLGIEKDKCPINEQYPISNDQEQFKQIFRSNEMLGNIYILFIMLGLLIVAVGCLKLMANGRNEIKNATDATNEVNKIKKDE